MPYRAEVEFPDELIDAVAERVLARLCEQPQLSRWLAVPQAAEHLAYSMRRLYTFVSQRRIRTSTRVGAPASGLLWNAIGFHLGRRQLGKLHQRYVRELLN